MEEYTKKSLGINGIHNRLGREISEAEFRGYMIAKQEERDRQITEIHVKIEETHNYIKELVKEGEKTHAILGGRITVLEKQDATSKGFAAGIAVVAAFFSAVITAAGMKLLGL